MKIQWIGERESGDTFIYRLFKIVWVVGEGAGKGYPSNYHSVLTIAVSNKWWYRRIRTDRKVITFLGLRIVYKREYGGTKLHDPK